MTASNHGPLAGITVLDFTRAVAGAYTTRLMADMGARILKIEAPEAGEAIRYNNIDHPAISKNVPPTLSPQFVYSNAGKECICMDLKKPESIELIKRLVPLVDVVMENFTAHVMPSLGLSYDELSKIRPDIIMCSLTGFGQEGPLANHPSNDSVGQAMGGMTYMTGEWDGYPVLAGNGIADTATGTMAALAILAAIIHRSKTGEGQYIDIAMMDTVMGLDCTGHPYYAASHGEYTVKRSAPDHFLLSPWGVYKGPNNRYFALLSQWPRLCEVMGRPDLIDEPEFATPEARLANRGKIRAIIEPFLQSFESDDEAFQALIDAKIAAGPVLDPWEVQHHPQMATRNAVREVPYPLGISYPTIATPLHFSKTPINVGRAPLIGEHNRSVLREFLDLSDEELDRLHAVGALYEDVTVKHLLEQ